MYTEQYKVMCGCVCVGEIGDKQRESERKGLQERIILVFSNCHEGRSLLDNLKPNFINISSLS